MTVWVTRNDGVVEDFTRSADHHFSCSSSQRWSKATVQNVANAFANPRITLQGGFEATTAICTNTAA